MARRLPRVAGRHLPVRRIVATAIASAALGAGTAHAQGEWFAAPVPGSAPVAATAGPATAGTPSPESVWGVAPTPDTAGAVWQAAEGDTTVASASGGALTASEIFDNFVNLPGGGGDPADPALPPAAPAAFDAPAADVQLDPDHPAVVALAAARRELDDVAAALIGVRTSLQTAGEVERAELEAREATLVARKSATAARVERLQNRVDALTRKLAERQAALTTANPFFGTPGLTYAPTTGTVPTIDANLASRLDAYLAGKGSPLAGLGPVFVYQSTAVGLDPRLLVAISGAETSFGTYGPSQRIHNPFGMGPGIVYPTWEDSIAAAARNLGGQLYKGSGLVTIAQIQRRWAPLGAGNDPTNLNSHWFRNVSRYYVELGGDPNGSVFMDRRPATAIPVAPGVAPGIQGTVAAPAAYGVAVPVPGGGRGVGPKAAALAQRYIGTPYLWGGTTPKGFDCSGLVQFVYARHGVRLPRVAEDQARVGTPVAPEQLQPGDAIFFADRTGYIHHEGLYVGDGYFVHAPHTGDVVKISSLYEPYYATQYAGARRY